MVWCKMKEMMELNREHNCTMIQYYIKAGLNEAHYMERWQFVFGIEAPSTATIYRWFLEFRHKRIFGMMENILEHLVQSLLQKMWPDFANDNRRPSMSMEMLEATLDIGIATVYRIGCYKTYVATQINA